jgi:hypothetical protein
MRQYKFFIFLLLVGLLLTTACEDYLDINENPNTATEAPINGLLANASSQTALNYYRVGNFTSYFVQYLASPNEGSNSDTYIESDYSGTWGNLYGAMTDLYDLQQFGLEKNAFQHVAVAKVLTAMNLGLLVDAWGAVPYSDAFTGETITPTYDSAEDIYDAIFELLAAAETDFDNPANEVNIDGDSDFVHGGDIEAWKLTIEALRARYLNHLSQTGNYDANAVLSAVSQSYQSNANDAEVTKFEIRNPWGQAALNNENLLLDGWLSDQFVDATNGTTFGVVDPRLMLLATLTEDSTFVGTPNGSGRVGDGTAAIESYLSTSGALSSDNSPLQLITYAEIKLIEAEAALRSNQTDRALMAFQEGIRASITKLFSLQGEDGSEAADTYLAEAYPDLTAGDLTLADVFREKYVALFLNPETWVDARRFDYQYEGFELPDNAALNTFILRVQYPDTELIRNTENTPAATLLDPLFWDK